MVETKVHFDVKFECLHASELKKYVQVLIVPVFWCGNVCCSQRLNSQWLPKGGFVLPLTAMKCAQRSPCTFHNIYWPVSSLNSSFRKKKSLLMIFGGCCSRVVIFLLFHLGLVVKYIFGELLVETKVHFDVKFECLHASELKKYVQVLIVPVFWCGNVCCSQRLNSQWLPKGGFVLPLTAMKCAQRSPCTFHNIYWPVSSTTTAAAHAH